MFSYAFLMMDFWGLKDGMSLNAGDVAGWLSTCLACHEHTEAPGSEKRNSHVSSVLGNLRNLHPFLYHSEYYKLVLVH